MPAYDAHDNVFGFGVCLALLVLVLVFDVFGLGLGDHTHHMQTRMHACLWCEYLP